jgi:hypothetical protein
MLYREVGDLKASYKSDHAILALRRSASRLALLLAFMF